MRILLWHVHGSWATAFVQGRHRYVVPVLPDRGADGVGRARTWDWPATVTELPPERLRHEDFDLVLLQRPHEVELAATWLGRRPGVDLPAVYVEHNTPEGSPGRQRHPLADRDDIPIVHVTHFNDLFWDNGRAPTVVVEHGVVDPGLRYTGELAAGAVVLNEAGRRGRVVGADLVPRFAGVAPVDLFGMDSAAFVAGLGTSAVTAHQDLRTQDEMHTALARRRVYLHPTRWTSLGLSLIEAMHLGMPVVAVAATEVVEAVPPGAGVISTDVARLLREFDSLMHEPEQGVAMGRLARTAALARYGLNRFLADWDDVLDRVVSREVVSP
ncbi:glycosyltransferase [Nakamurella deserti]|uniref:glycosyltransferase n=1 Tax=Nakamurella deserti TaxID=2164074 RepID=UPI000DBE8E86|nr:glycosyltransferase [Nakamurella deserti]